MKKLKVSLHSLILFFIVSSLILLFITYLTRINIYENAQIRVTQSDIPITKGISIIGIEPLLNKRQIDFDNKNNYWFYQKDYYTEIIFKIDTNLIDTKLGIINIEIIEFKTNKKLWSASINSKNNTQISYNGDDTKNYLNIIQKIASTNYSYFTFLLAFLLSILTFYIFLKTKLNIHINLINKSMYVAIILWGLCWLIIASFYTFPSAEDLVVSIPSKSDNFLKSPFQLLNSSDSRYFTNFLYGINPLAWGYYNWYKFIPIFTLLFLITSLFFFLHLFFKNLNKIDTLILSLFLTIYHFLFIPSIGDQLYWMASSFVYLFPWILVFIWISSFVMFLHSINSKTKFKYLSITLLSLISSYGCNEMMLIINPVFILIISHLIVKHYPEKKHELYMILLIAISSSIVILASQGGKDRFDNVDLIRNNYFIWKMILISSSQFFETIYHWVFKSMITIPLIISTYFLFIQNKQSTFFITKKQLQTIIVFFLISSYIASLIYYYSIGIKYYPTRVFNFLNWMFILIAFIFLPMLSDSFQNRFFKTINYYKNQITSSLLVFSIIFILMGNNNLTLIINEYDNGTLSEYKNQMLKRYKNIENSKKDISPNFCWIMTEVDSITAKPISIFQGPDLHPNKKNIVWNKAYEAYFNIDEIKIKGDTISKIKMLSIHVQ